MDNAQTTDADHPSTLLPMSGVVASPFEFDLKVAGELGAKANGVEIVTLKAPAELKGVPAEIPVGIKRGQAPDFATLDDLFEAYRLFPEAKTGTATVQTFSAFCDLTNRHKTPDSVIFADADWKKPAFTAVIDYHRIEGGQADNLKHRILYTFPLSDAWMAWVNGNGKQMTQADFAYFLEDRIADLSSPTDIEKRDYEARFQTKIGLPTQVMDLARGLQVHVDTKVKQAVKLQSGESQIAWEEVHKDADGTPVKVPGIFMLNVEPFFMGDKVRIPVRLRYRPANGQLVWFYDIYRPDEAINQHVRTTLAEAREKTGLHTYEGKPEA